MTAYLRPRTNVAMARYMTEDELLQAITDAATYLGWRWYHVRRSDKAVTMGHSGFPDLVVAKGGRVLFLELKSMEGSLTVDQTVWLQELESGSGDVRVVRPTDLDAILVLLGAKLIPGSGEMAAAT